MMTDGKATAIAALMAALGRQRLTAYRCEWVFSGRRWTQAGFDKAVSLRADDRAAMEQIASDTSGDYYYLLNGSSGGRRNEDIVSLKAFYVDDVRAESLVKGPDGLLRLPVFPDFIPTVIRTSGNSHQLVYPIETDASLALLGNGMAERMKVAKSLVTEFARRAGGDPGGSNLNQVFRLPGSVNHKPLDFADPNSARKDAPVELVQQGVPCRLGDVFRRLRGVSLPAGDMTTRDGSRMSDDLILMNNLSGSFNREFFSTPSEAAGSVVRRLLAYGMEADGIAATLSSNQLGELLKTPDVGRWVRNCVKSLRDDGKDDPVPVRHPEGHKPSMALASTLTVPDLLYSSAETVEVHIDSRRRVERFGTGMSRAYANLTLLFIGHAQHADENGKVRIPLDLFVGKDRLVSERTLYRSAEDIVKLGFVFKTGTKDEGGWAFERFSPFSRIERDGDHIEITYDQQFTENLRNAPKNEVKRLGQVRDTILALEGLNEFEQRLLLLLSYELYINHANLQPRRDYVIRIGDIYPRLIDTHEPGDLSEAQVKKCGTMLYAAVARLNELGKFSRVGIDGDVSLTVSDRTVAHFVHSRGRREGKGAGHPESRSESAPASPSA